MGARYGLAIAIALLAGRAGAGETACRVENGAVVIPAAFGDMAGDFILDASAPVSQLHQTTAQADGIESATVVRPLETAGVRLEGFRMEVADLDSRDQGFVTNISGVLGADLIGRFVVDIRFSPCRVRMSSQAQRPLAGSVKLSVRWAGGVPTVAAAIADREGKSRAGFFSIDMGSAGSRVARAGFSRPLPPGADPASRPAPPARLRALSLAGALYENTPAGVLGETPAPLAGAIGLAVWSRYRMRLDLGRGWLELAPASTGRSAMIRRAPRSKVK
ncbi:MAG: hypothetical protein ACYC8V_03370 [Caulobacteraceae bacterium]